MFRFTKRPQSKLLMVGDSPLSGAALAHAIAGTCGSVVSMLLTAPLDTARMRIILDDKETIDNNTHNMNSSRSIISKNGQDHLSSVMLRIVAEEGVFGLFYGLLSNLQSVAASSFIHFYLFHGLRQGTTAQAPSASTDLIFASIAGAGNVLITNPLWVINTKIRAQRNGGSKRKENIGDINYVKNYNSLTEGLYHTYTTCGPSALWSGVLPSLALVLNPAIKFAVYECMGRGLTHTHRIQLSFPVGVAASIVATVATYPMQLLQIKQRHGHTYEGLKADAGLVSLLIYIVRNLGFLHLYCGLEAKLYQTFLASGLMFLTYEYILMFTIAICKCD